MKKLLLFTGLLLLCNKAILGQNSIEGLGKIRISMPEQDFLQMLRDNYYGSPVVLKTKRELNSATDRKVYKLGFDVVNDKTVYYSRCRQARLYFLLSFSIGNNIEIQKVYALFFESFLIDIIVDFSQELGSDITAKYGMPTPAVAVNSTGSLCNNPVQSSDKYPFNLLKGAFPGDLYSVRFDYFFRNDTISATASVKRFLDNKCEMKEDDVIRIYHRERFKSFVKCH